MKKDRPIPVVLRPGWVRAMDGDRHYIGVCQLAFLYGVDARDCEVWEEHRRYPEGTVFLRPRRDGMYRSIKGE